MHQPASLHLSRILTTTLANTRIDDCARLPNFGSVALQPIYRESRREPLRERRTHSTIEKDSSSYREHPYPLHFPTMRREPRFLTQEPYFGAQLGTLLIRTLCTLITLRTCEQALSLLPRGSTR